MRLNKQATLSQRVGTEIVYHPVKFNKSYKTRLQQKCRKL